MNRYSELKRIIRKLRGPRGCPWDRKQNHLTLLPYLRSEELEFRDSVRKKDYAGMEEELGDILLQVFIHSQIASEKGKFCIDDVFSTLCRKLVRRHPHVFGGLKVRSMRDIIFNWERIKQEEKRKKSR